MATGIFPFLKKLIVRQPQWRKEDVYDATFTLRLLIGAVFGLVCGGLQLQGLYVFIAFIAASIFLLSAWFEYQGIIPDEVDGGQAADAGPSQLSSEGLGQSIPLFLVSFAIVAALQYYSLSTCCAAYKWQLDYRSLSFPAAYLDWNVHAHAWHVSVGLSKDVTRN